MRRFWGLRATAAVTLLAVALQSVALAQPSDFCPLVPQTRRPFKPANDGRYITLTAGVPASIEYRLKHAKPTDIVLVDGPTLSDTRVRDALGTSRAQVVLKTDQTPDRVAQLLSRPVAATEIIAAIPSSGQGVEAMYGLTGEAQARALRHFRENVAKPMIAGIPSVTVASEKPRVGTIASFIERRARTSTPESPLIVIGHNENGMLLLPDGSSLEIAKIQSLGSESNRPVLVLSCETMASVASAGMASTRRFGFDELAAALSTARARVLQRDAPQLGHLIQELNISLNNETGKTQRRVRVAFAVVGGALIIVAIVLAFQDDE
jgi:hypothetical protein